MGDIKACKRYSDIHAFFRDFTYDQIKGKQVLPISTLLNKFYEIIKILKKEVKHRDIIPIPMVPNFGNILLVVYCPLIETSFCFKFDIATQYYEIIPYTTRIVTFNDDYDPYSVYFYRLNGSFKPICEAIYRYKFVLEGIDIDFDGYTYSNYCDIYTTVFRCIILEIEKDYNLIYSNAIK